MRDEINEYYWDFKLTPDLIELRNIATTAELITQAALFRKESRGLHYNLDTPSATTNTSSVTRSCNAEMNRA